MSGDVPATRTIDWDEYRAGCGYALKVGGELRRALTGHFIAHIRRTSAETGLGPGATADPGRIEAKAAELANDTIVEAGWAMDGGAAG